MQSSKKSCFREGLGCPPNFVFQGPWVHAHRPAMGEALHDSPLLRELADLDNRQARARLGSQGRGPQGSGESAGESGSGLPSLINHPLHAIRARHLPSCSPNSMPFPPTC